jgi:hypothetical protein
MSSGFWGEGIRIIGRGGRVLLPGNEIRGIEMGHSFSTPIKKVSPSRAMEIDGTPVSRYASILIGDEVYTTAEIVTIVLRRKLDNEKDLLRSQMSTPEQREAKNAKARAKYAAMKAEKLRLESVITQEPIAEMIRAAVAEVESKGKPRVSVVEDEAEVMLGPCETESVAPVSRHREERTRPSSTTPIPIPTPAATREPVPLVRPHRPYRPRKPRVLPTEITPADAEETEERAVPVQRARVNHSKYTPIVEAALRTGSTSTAATPPPPSPSTPAVPPAVPQSHRRSVHDS